MIPGTQGYAEQAPELISRYEEIGFVDRHRWVLHLLPSAPGVIVDIGAGTGLDAAWLAAQGHRVVAVEPTREFRDAALRLHPSASIEWLDDGLPDLALLQSRRGTFDVVMLTAVWMHLDANERERAMPNLAALPKPGGLIVMSLRHGPVPEGRRMFDVSGEETIALAARHGLEPLLHTLEPSLHALNLAAGVTWTRLAFRRTPPL